MRAELLYDRIFEDNIIWHFSISFDFCTEKMEDCDKYFPQMASQMETQLVTTVFCYLFGCWIPGFLYEMTILADSLVSYFSNTFFFQ